MGALFGEALVINDPLLKKDFRYHMKQRGGMLAKGRLLGIQFEALFEDGLYDEIGQHAVQQSQKIAIGVQAKGYALFSDSPTNQVFPILSRELLKSLSAEFGYAFWQTFDAENDVVRFCTSWATPPEMVDALLASIPPKRDTSKKRILI